MSGVLDNARTRRLSPRVAARVTMIAALLSIGIAVLVPAGHLLIGQQRERVIAGAAATQTAQAISALVFRSPSHWRYETGRLLELMQHDGEGDGVTHRRLLDSSGATVTETGPDAAWPTVTARAPVHDFGQEAATVEATRSLRPLLGEVLATALLAALAGLLSFAVFRLLPLRLLRLSMAEAEHLAQHDVLTGLPNRDVLRARLAEMIAPDAEGGHATLLVVDLDRFKPINDLHGHAVGDGVLREVAERLRDSTRPMDLTARLGGDEFAIVAPLQPVAAEGLARRLVAALERPFTIGETVVRIGASIGVAICERGKGDPDMLFAQADAALDRAKSEGRGRFRVFDPAMDGQLRDRAALEAELREAIARDELVPYFQPLVDLGSGRLTGFELLARWPHKARGMVSPGEFVPVAEQCGMIGAMTERLLLRGCRAAVTWPGDIALSVNLSPRQVFDRTLVDMIRNALRQTGLPPHRLDLELTESALVGDLAAARNVLAELKALGVRLSLDDFGTGYSSLAHLQALPFDKLKIDAGFVRAMAGDADSRKIVAAVVGLGHSLGLPTVAEGVETEAQLETLRQLGCDVGQGWLFGAATPEAKAAEIAHRATAEGGLRAAAGG
jgi:diguanylate cyclase (GGDEF)-like protein